MRLPAWERALAAQPGTLSLAWPKTPSLLAQGLCPSPLPQSTPQPRYSPEGLTQTWPQLGQKAEARAVGLLTSLGPPLTPGGGWKEAGGHSLQGQGFGGGAVACILAPSKLPASSQQVPVGLEQQSPKPVLCPVGRGWGCPCRTQTSRQPDQVRPRTLLGTSSDGASVSQPIKWEKKGVWESCPGRGWGSWGGADPGQQRRDRVTVLEDWKLGGLGEGLR